MNVPNDNTRQHRLRCLTSQERSMLAYAIDYLLQTKPPEWWIGAMAEESKTAFKNLHEELIKDF